MSGIAGILTIEQQLNSVAMLKTMMDTIRHRGPDGEGYFITQQASLGYMHFDVHALHVEQVECILFMDRYAVALDGRIYNLPELQKELSEQGYKFECKNDAELLAAAYDCWGVDCLNKFNADWAFVLYDIKTKNIFISRDRFGAKPLYYYIDTEKFVFGSEVKTIYASGKVTREANETYLKSYLEKGSNEYDAATAFKDIMRFPFAHYFLGTVEQLLVEPKFTRYWKPQVNTVRETFDLAKAKQYADQYYELLADAVRIRMRGSVKVGAALSGGLDSSSIVYLMHQELMKKNNVEALQTFSSVYQTPGTEHCDESEFINMVSEQLGVVSNQIEPRVADVPAEHEKMIRALENPPANSMMSSWHSFKLMQLKDCKVSLEGQGADEILAGYESYLYWHLLSLGFVHFYFQLFRIFIRNRQLKMFLFCFAFYSLSRIVGYNLSERILKKFIGKNFPVSLNLALLRSVQTGLANNLQVDVAASSAHSVELRYPFLDLRLVDYVFSIPECYKMNLNWSKYIARLAFDSKLNDSITWRVDKMGWPIPEKYWFNGQLKSWFDSNVNDNELKHKVSFSKRVRLLNLSVFKKVFGF